LHVQILQQACAWSKLEPACQRLDSQTEKELAAGKCPSEQPFLNFTRHADPALNLRIARAWSDAFGSIAFQAWEAHLSMAIETAKMEEW
jgi:hypothetical protein